MFLVLFHIPTSPIDIISKVLAVSPSTVRQEIIDDENDWKEWKIKNEIFRTEECENPLMPTTRYSIFKLYERWR